MKNILESFNHIYYANRKYKILKCFTMAKLLKSTSLIKSIKRYFHSSLESSQTLYTNGFLYIKLYLLFINLSYSKSQYLFFWKPSVQFFICLEKNGFQRSLPSILIINWMKFYFLEEWNIEIHFKIFFSLTRGGVGGGTLGSDVILNFFILF